MTKVREIHERFFWGDEQRAEHRVAVANELHQDLVETEEASFHAVHGFRHDMAMIIHRSFSPMEREAEELAAATA